MSLYDAGKDLLAVLWGRKVRKEEVDITWALLVESRNLGGRCQRGWNDKVAEELDVSHQKVRECVERMLNRGLLKEWNRGRWRYFWTQKAVDLYTAMRLDRRDEDDLPPPIDRAP